MDIETPRLMLVESYQPLLEHVAWLNDKELMKWSEQQFEEHDMISQNLFLERAQADGTPLVYDIMEKALSGPIIPGRIVGSLHIHVNKHHARADLGIMIGTPYGKKGYAKEAWKAAQDYCFVKLRMMKLEAGCALPNVGMIRILMSLNWREEGIRESHFLYNGRRYDLVQFGKFA
jgi:[ribosomal protein S5]-alanine N-acetyltransferase